MSAFDVFGLSAAGWRARFVGLWHAALGWSSARPLAAGSALLLGAAVGLAVNYVVGPRRFAATAGISVSSNPGIELPSALTSLAASTGLRLGSTTLPLAFQSDILASAPFQDSVLLVPDAAACGLRRCRLLEALEADSGVLTGRLAHARRTMNKRLEVVRDERSRVITIAYRDPDSTLARAVVATTVVVLDNTNKRLTSTAADAKVEFLSSQLPFLQRQLQAIQDSLEAFYTSNRLFENSPSLRFREQRLRGQYDSQLRLLESVREQLATSELQARGGVQVVQTVMPVSVDPKPVRPLRNLALVLGMVLATLTGIALWNGSVRPH